MAVGATGSHGPRPDAPAGAPSIEEQIGVHTRRQRRRFGGFGALVVLGLSALFLINGHPHHVLRAGTRLPPFAVPAALGTLSGDANVATHAHEGEAGSRPACSVRGTQIVNICQLVEQAPVVLSLFLSGSGSGGQDVLNTMQTLAHQFPSVRFIGVGVKGNRAALRTWVRAERLTVPVGYDRDGALATLYDMLAPPEIVFAYPGGVVQSTPLYDDSSLATLRARVRQLIVDARARGWKLASA